MGIKSNEATERCFKSIKKYTKFCASCGKPFNMSISGHHHFPFCEVCRIGIIQKEMGTTERTKASAQLSSQAQKKT